MTRTENHSVNSLNRRDVEPVIGVLLQTRRTRLPVGKLLLLVGTADKETSNFVLSGNDQQAVVGMRANAATRLPLAVSTIARRKSKGTKCETQLRQSNVSPEWGRLTGGLWYGANRRGCSVSEIQGRHSDPSR